MDKCFQVPLSSRILWIIAIVFYVQTYREDTRTIVKGTLDTLVILKLKTRVIGKIQHATLKL
jgi:hypothetical protein